MTNINVGSLIIILTLCGSKVEGRNGGKQLATGCDDLLCDVFEFLSVLRRLDLKTTSKNLKPTADARHHMSLHSIQ